VLAILLSEKMDPFYTNITSFPTVIFTFTLILCVLYWLVALLGWVDVEVFDFDIPDVDIDTISDSGVSNADALAGLFLRFGLHGVPVTIILTIVSLFGWLVSYYMVYLLWPLIPFVFLEYLVGLPVLFAALYIAVMITAKLIKPLRVFFNKAQQETVKNILGQTAIVRTSRVDNSFGEVNLDDGGAGLIIKARTRNGDKYKKGERVVLLEHIEESNHYIIISEKEFNKI